MTFDEFRPLAKGLKAVYTSPNFLPDADSVKIWYQMLHDLDYHVASAAIQKIMMTSKFPPTIAEIREQATSVIHGEKPLWSDGWEQVQRAIRNYGTYNIPAAMESLDGITKQTVKRLGFRNLCVSENPSVDRANFRTIFEQLANRKQADEQIPAGLHQLIESIQDGKKGILEGYDSKRISDADH